jgi:hypothetical protein
MAVGPVGLESVVADWFYGLESERVRTVALRSAAGHAAEEVRLAGTDRARTSAAKLFERIV